MLDSVGVKGSEQNMSDADVQAWLNPDDVARVAEFFDCDVDAAFEFMRSVWLPDASATAMRMLRALRAREWTSLLYLCDHLREGARCVGALRIVVLASAIEGAAESKQVGTGLACVRKLRESLDVLGSLLLDSPRFQSIV